LFRKREPTAAVHVVPTAENSDSFRLPPPPARNCSAAVLTDPGSIVQVVMNFIVFGPPV